MDKETVKRWKEIIDRNFEKVKPMGDDGCSNQKFYHLNWIRDWEYQEFKTTIETMLGHLAGSDEDVAYCETIINKQKDMIEMLEHKVKVLCEAGGEDV